RIEPGRGERAASPVAGTARVGGAQDLPGIQIRRDGRNPLLSGFHHQVAPVYGPRTPQNRAGSDSDTRCLMSCSPFDLRDYFLKELPDSERRQAEAHVRNCQPCLEELDRLRLTEAALFALRE